MAVKLIVGCTPYYNACLLRALQTVVGPLYERKQEFVIRKRVQYFFFLFRTANM